MTESVGVSRETQPNLSQIRTSPTDLDTIGHFPNSFCRPRANTTLNHPVPLLLLKMANGVQAQLQKITAIPENTSVLIVFFPETTAKSIKLSAIRRAYFCLCLQVHPDKGGAGNVEDATRCTQKISKCFELAKEYAERNGKSHNCLIPETVRFKGFKNVDDVQLHEADRPCPQSDVFRDDVDDIFDGFFPSDEEEFMRKEPSGKSHRYQKWSGYHSSSSDDSVVFVSEKQFQSTQEPHLQSQIRLFGRLLPHQKQPLSKTNRKTMWKSCSAYVTVSVPTNKEFEKRRDKHWQTKEEHLKAGVLNVLLM